MDIDKIKEAVKTVQSQKPKENYLIIQLSWDTKLVLPYKDGMVFISSLSNAEILESDYQKGKKIVPIKSDQLSTNILSTTEYQHIKIANLLGVNSDEVQTHLEKLA